MLDHKNVIPVKYSGLAHISLEAMTLVVQSGAGQRNSSSETHFLATQTPVVCQSPWNITSSP